jgi:hypothetical protein
MTCMNCGSAMVTDPVERIDGQECVGFRCIVCSREYKIVRDRTDLPKPREMEPLDNISKGHLIWKEYDCVICGTHVAGMVMWNAVCCDNSRCRMERYKRRANEINRRRYRMEHNLMHLEEA